MTTPTLHADGTLDGRPYAVVHADNPRAKRYQCLECLARTAANAPAFTAHRCAEKSSGAATTPKQKDDAA